MQERVETFPCRSQTQGADNGFGGRISWVTLGVVGLSMVVYLFPGIQAFLVYDRAAILGGEVWRMITCHLVHFSAQHFIYDTVAFGAAGWMIERLGYRNFGWLCALAAIGISGGVLLCEPRLQICGGLSGLATAAVVFLAVHGMEERGGWRWLCVTALILTVAKLAVELITGRFVFLQTRDGFVSVPANHIAGALAAIGVYAWGRGIKCQPWRTRKLC